MSRSFADARRWMREGTQGFLDVVAELRDDDLSTSTLLQGWTRRHLIAHVAANADALGNLVRWAATGEKTPMYASPHERAAGIERGLLLDGVELRDWLVGSAATLEHAMADLGEEQWRTSVLTAQGRTVPATETPWMRSREVCVHLVDLNCGVGFSDLPPDFLDALVEEITAKRGDAPAVDGPLPEIAAWLAGRPHKLTNAPTLAPWL